MKSVLKKLVLAGGMIFILLPAFAAWYFFARLAPIGAGYKAKIMCSCVFNGGRTDLDQIRSEDLAPVNPLLVVVEAEPDLDKKSVTATAAGLVKRTAVYREGLGCTLLPDPSFKPAGPQSLAIEPLPRNPGLILWPTGDLMAEGTMPPEVDREKLSSALDRAFAEPDPERLRLTRAVVVVYKGRIIAERYAPGFDRDTSHQSWSMTKSVTSALIGVLVKQGRLQLDRPAPVPEWQRPGDPRSQITVSHLLRMSGGIDFHNDMNPVGHRQLTLFGAIDSASYTAARPLYAVPGEVWEYSNANPLMLYVVMHTVLGGDVVDYLEFPRRELFNKIGMRSALIEPDPFGNFLGTSFGWASARDWARFGLLYLNDGVWEGERILPEGWVEYTTTPAPAAPLKNYGALFWLNDGADLPADALAGKDPGTPPWPRLPKDAFFAIGMWDQNLAIIPSCELVVARLGYTYHPGAFDIEEFLEDLIEAVGRK
jgi:CubicO group peptidase (beta-lactamase class C family)